MHKMGEVKMADECGRLPNDILEKMNRFRASLLRCGMREPTKRQSKFWHWLFYHPVTDLTAFVVNLRAKKSSIEIVYGYASTAFTRRAGDEKALLESGISDENITIREKVLLLMKRMNTLQMQHNTTV